MTDATSAHEQARAFIFSIFKQWGYDPGTGSELVVSHEELENALAGLAGAMGYVSKMMEDAGIDVARRSAIVAKAMFEGGKKAHMDLEDGRAVGTGKLS